MASLQYNTEVGTSTCIYLPERRGRFVFVTCCPHYPTHEEKERRASELEASAAFLDFIYAAMLVYSWLWYRTRRSLCGRRPFWWLGAPPLGPPENNSANVS